jgi:hypothetical protein
MGDLPEEKSLWKEKQDAEKLDPEDTFIPAKEAPLDKENALVHIVL